MNIGELVQTSTGPCLLWVRAGGSGCSSQSLIILCSTLHFNEYGGNIHSHALKTYIHIQTNKHA